MKNVLCLTGVFLFAITTYAQDCNLNQDAQRYWVRAQAALKDAKSEKDYFGVCEEFKKASQYAPDCPDIYYNMGLCYEKSASTDLVKDIYGISQAIVYLKKYLEIKPDAQNKQEVQNKIYELEFKHEKLYNNFPFIGKYETSCVPPKKFELKMDKNQIIAIVPQDNTETKYDTLVVEDYKTKEGEENLKFFQKQYTSYKQNKKKSGFDPKNYWDFSENTYYLTCKNSFVFQYYVESCIPRKNNKIDIEMYRLLNGLDNNGNRVRNGLIQQIFTADKITKIEPSSAAQSPISSNPTDNDKNNKSTDNQQSGSDKKNTHKSVGSSIVSTILK